MSTVSHSSDDFASIYDAVIAEVMFNVERQGATPDSVTIEPTNIAAHCFMDVPYKELLTIEGDEEFVIACGSKIWDRLMGEPQKLVLLEDLQSGVSREQLMARMTENALQSAVVLGSL